MKRRTLAQLYDRDAPLIDGSLDYDPAAHADEAPADVRPLMEQANPWALLAGRVEAVYDGDPSRDSVADLTGLVDSKAGTVRTTNGELTLDHKAGLLRINAPRAQGVVGFLKDAGGSFHLADVDIRSGNEYAGVVLVPLDGAPLARSQKVLVQVGTIAHPTGWATRAATRKVKGQEVSGREIVSTGNMPWRMGDADVELTVRNQALRQATRLDVMGFASETVPVEPAEGGVHIKLPPDTLYLVLSSAKPG